MAFENAWAEQEEGQYKESNNNNNKHTCEDTESNEICRKKRKNDKQTNKQTEKQKFPQIGEER